MNAALDAIIDAVRAAGAAGAGQRRALCIRGGGSKDFYGRPALGDPLDVRGYAGIVAYDPTELVVTARCGTPLAELEATLAANGQMLAFEPPNFDGQSNMHPPRFGASATVGGMLAAGLSGPRRQVAGALRDFVLGVTMLDGRGESLTFGGQVMKNVAGYDVSRLMAGSLGTLGIILEVSLKTLPRPVVEETLAFEMPEDKAIATLNRWAGQPLPLSASAWCAGELHVRLSGAAAAVAAARKKLGGQCLDAASAGAFWTGIREQTAAFFCRAQQNGQSPSQSRSQSHGQPLRQPLRQTPGQPLWRLSLPSTTAASALDPVSGERLIEWGGALRWVVSGSEAASVREVAAKAGGHATLFRAADETRQQQGVFQPLAPATLAIHRKLKAGFDPHGLFNPGRMYAEF